MSDDGSQEIEAQLARLIRALEGPAVMEAGAQWLEQDAKPRAKAIVPVLSGDTRDSIDGVAGPGGVTVYAGTSYAADIEYGTSQKDARPFLLPAFRQTLDRLGTHLRDALERRK